MNTTPVAQSINLDGDISSRIFPLTRRWLIIEILEKLVGSLVVIGVSIFDAYSGPSGIFMQFLFTLDFVVFVFLGLIAAISTIAFIGVLQSLRLFLGFEYVLTSTGIEYRVAKQDPLKYLPYDNIREVAIKRGVLGRMFGYAVVWINPPSWRQRFYFVKSGASTLALRGLLKNDAVYITEFLRRQAVASVLNQ